MATTKRNPNAIARKGLRTTLIGIIVSALLAVVKALGGIYGHSYALVADAVESATDVLTSSVLWVGLRWASRPPDGNHPYGHGKGEALLSVGISIILVLAAYVITKDSIIHMMTPHATPAPFTLVILLAVMVSKELLYRFVLHTGKRIKSGALKADALHHRSDAITSAAAFLGISIALIGGKGYETADDWAALVAAGFILYNAYKLARPAIGELLDEALEPDFHHHIEQLAEKVPGVKHVQKCHIRKMGTAYHVDLHIWVNGSLSVEAGHEISHQVKDLILHEVKEVMNVHIHVEPYEATS